MKKKIESDGARHDDKMGWIIAVVLIIAAAVFYFFITRRVKADNGPPEEPPEEEPPEEEPPEEEPPEEEPPEEEPPEEPPAIPPGYTGLTCVIRKSGVLTAGAQIKFIRAGEVIATALSNGSGEAFVLLPAMLTYNFEISKVGCAGTNGSMSPFAAGPQSWPFILY